MPRTSAKAPPPAITVVHQAGPTGRPAYYAMWRHRRVDGTTRLMKRKLGAAWLEQDPAGRWIKRKGRVAAGYLDARGATVAAAELVEEVEAELALAATKTVAEHCESQTFRAVAADFLRHREEVKGTRPSTLIDYRAMLADPGTPHKRGWQRNADGTIKRDRNGDPVRSASVGWIMRRIGDKPAAEVTTRDIEGILNELSKSGLAATTVNKYRCVMSSIFSYAKRGSTYGLPTNPVRDADRRREPPPADIEFYTVEEIEALARAMYGGAHRGQRRGDTSPEEVEQRRREDHQDAELIRVAGYTGLRRSELVALRWRDVSFATRQVHVRRTLSARVEVDAPKSGKRRVVPMTDRALTALDRLAQRRDFTGPDDYVAMNVMGGRIDPDAFGTRVTKAQANAALRVLNLHGLRHSFASQLVAAGVGLADVQSALGHSKIETTSRYLHARPATQLAEIFSRAQDGATTKN